MLRKQLDKFGFTIKEIAHLRKAKKGANKNNEEINQILKTLKDGKSNG